MVNSFQWPSFTSVTKRFPTDTYDWQSLVGPGRPTYTDPGGGFANTPGTTWPAGTTGGGANTGDVSGATYDPSRGGAPDTMGAWAAANPPANAGGGGWDIPDWALGSNQLFGSTYQGNGQWAPGAPLAAGTQVFGAALPTTYNPAADTRRHDFSTHAASESNASKALRYAHDRFAQGGISRDDALKYGIARLYSDYRNTGQDWAQSGFGDVSGFADYVNRYNPNTGGGGMVTNYRPDQGPGGSPGYTPAAGGGGATGSFGGGNGQLGPVSLQTLLQNPQQGFRYLLQSMGYNPDVVMRGAFGANAQKTLAPLLNAVLQARLEAGGTMDNLQSYVGDFGKSLGGGGFYGGLGDLAGQALAGIQGKLGTMDDRTASDALNRALTLRTLNMAPSIANAIGNEYDTMANAFQDQAFYDPLGVNKSPFGTYASQSDLFRRLLSGQF
ncbi:MAG TPA: hypothetical protein VF041_23355 [Gemmatimonadaceae bacterium]